MDWSLQELQQAVGGDVTWSSMPPRDGKQASLRRVVIDSRDVQPGDLFVAMQGDRCHGAEFAHEAMFRGAVGVLSDREVVPIPGTLSLTVPDARLALWEMAAWQRQQLSGTVVAVTGSVGKTTTREMIYQVLTTQGCGTVSKKNFNNEIGVPLSLLDAGPRDDYVVLELAARRAGEIESLAQLCQPDIGVLTPVGDAHVGCFGSERAIVDAKCELLSEIDRDGVAVVAGDDPMLRRVAGQADVETIWYGRSADNDCVGTDVRWCDGRLAFRVSGVSFSIPVWGRHHLDAALAAISVGRLFGRTLAEMADALSEFQSVAMRCEVFRADGMAIIQDAYNGSPVSFKAALALLREFGTSGRRVVACGDMLDLGTDSERMHRRLGQQMVTIGGADMLLVCGQYAEATACGAKDAGMPVDAVKTYAGPTDMVKPLQEQMQRGDVLLVKASRALNMEQAVHGILPTYGKPSPVGKVA